MRSELERSGWLYYGAIAVFLGILAFAILGLVRSSSVRGATTRGSAPEPTKTPAAASVLSAGPQPTVAIPPATPDAPTPPPSRTYVHPPPETGAVYSDPATAPLR